MSNEKIERPIGERVKSIDYKLSLIEEQAENLLTEIKGTKAALIMIPAVDDEKSRQVILGMIASNLEYIADIARDFVGKQADELSAKIPDMSYPYLKD